MSTENQNLDTQPTLPFVVTDGDEMTPEEKAYFEIGDKEPAQVPPVVAPESAEPEKPEKDDQEPPEADDDADVAVKLRDEKTGRFTKMVPHRALHAERERRKQAEAAQRESEKVAAVGDARLQLLMELAYGGQATTAGQPGQKTVNPLEEPDVDPAQDFVEAFAQQQRRTAYLQKQLQDRDQRVERIETGSTMAAVRQAYESDARKFATNEPSFAMAYKFLADNIRSEMKISNPAMTDEQIVSEINLNEGRLVVQALQQKQSPSELIWKLALARGFQKPDVKAQNGHLPPSPAAEKIDALKRGQEASVSMSNAAGTAGDSLTVMEMGRMSDDEYARVSARIGKAKMRALLGD